MELSTCKHCDKPAHKCDHGGLHAEAIDLRTELASVKAERDMLAGRVKELEGDISHAVVEAKRRCPDYPWQLNTASESVWALGESWLGASAAVDYISKRHVIERERLESALAAAVKERDEAVEALRPFGASSHLFAESFPDDCFVYHDADGDEPLFNLGDLRRAAALVARLDTSKGQS